MSAPPQSLTKGVPVTVDLSPQELAELQRYAQAHGLTPEQAASQAVSQALQVRYTTRKRINNIVRFPQ
jgi:hypothetical protein